MADSTGLLGSASWQPLVQSSTGSEDPSMHRQAPQRKAVFGSGLPSKREIFMSTLLTRLPTYALQLLAENNEAKLSCLARLSRDDLAAVLAQPHPQLLLEAVYHQQQQLQLAQDACTSSSDVVDLGDLEDSPFTRSMHNPNKSSVAFTEDDLLPQPFHLQSNSQCTHVANSSLLPCSSSTISGTNSPVCSSLAVAAAQSWPCASGTSCSSSSSRYRFQGMPVCAACGLKGHTAEACCTPRCNACQLWGHSGSECPSSQCWICGCFGHSFSDCPEQQPQLSLMSSVRSQPDSSILLSCTSSRGLSTLNSCGSSSMALLAAGSGTTRTSSASCEATAGSSRGSSDSSACPDTRSLNTSPAVIPVEAVAALSSSNGSGNKSAITPASPTAAPAPPPPAPPAAKSSSAASSSNKPRKYMFGGHGRGPLVCCKCGAMGHVADKCRTPHCSKCSRYGHSNSTCDKACSRCGKEHDGPHGTDCTARCCVSCGLWGHRPRNCPSAQCSTCSYFGHLAAQCMACPQCKKHGHTETKCPVMKLLGVDMLAVMISDSV